MQALITLLSGFLKSEGKVNARDSKILYGGTVRLLHFWGRRKHRSNACNESFTADTSIQSWGGAWRNQFSYFRSVEMGWRGSVTHLRLPS